MFLDKTTEAISYFIGLFQTVTEAVNSRIEYDSFRFFRAQQSLDPVPQQFVDRDFVYGPDGYDAQVRDPELSAIPAASLLKAPQISPPSHFLSGPAIPLGHDAGPLAVTIAAGAGGEFPPLLQAPPPNSVVHVTWQANTLTDQDIFKISSETARSFVQEQGEILAALQGQAAQLQVLSQMSPDLAYGDGNTGAAEAASAIFNQILARSEAAAEQVPDASIHLATGIAAQGVTVDGQCALEMPVWQELLPPSLQAGQDAGPEDDAQQAVVHARITGGNLALNEAVSFGGGVDAAAIVVGGDVVSLDVISQVSVLRDDAARAEAGNHVLNAASFAGQPIEGVAPETGLAGYVPGLVTMSYIDGDLITYDWIRQINAISDEDAVSFTFSGSESFVSVGENQAINSDILTTLGWVYDLIIIEGDWITQNVVSQTNILLDEDSVPWTSPGGDLHPGGVADSSGNALINSASITHSAVDQISALTAEFRELLGNFDPDAPDLSSVLTSALLAPMEVMNVLYISGDLLQMREVSQVNILSDSDLIQASGIGMPDGAGGVATGGNAAVNIASIFDAGVQSQVLAGGSVFSDAVLYQAKLISDDAPPANVMLAADSGAMLASEAVVFLADYAANGSPGDMDQGAAPAMVTEDGPPHPDVMQTMLA